MSIRFAAPASAIAPRLNARQVRARVMPAANDNGGVSDPALHAALRYFAQHGLAAARMARDEAEAAFFADDRDGYRRWHEVCRVLDRRMAAAIAFRR